MGKINYSNWTPERIDTITRLWSEGLSASLIADRIGGVSRNAVLGKLDRLGLLGQRVTVTRRKAYPTRKPKRKPSLPRPVKQTPLPPMPEPPQPKGKYTIQNIPDSGFCKWPTEYEATADLALCGRPTDKVYCQEHHKMAHTFTPEKKPKRRDAWKRVAA